MGWRQYESVESVRKHWDLSRRQLSTNPALSWPTQRFVTVSARRATVWDGKSGEALTTLTSERLLGNDQANITAFSLDHQVRPGYLRTFVDNHGQACQNNIFNINQTSLVSSAHERQPRSHHTPLVDMTRPKPTFVFSWFTAFSGRNAFTNDTPGCFRGIANEIERVHTVRTQSCFAGLAGKTNVLERVVAASRPLGRAGHREYVVILLPPFGSAYVRQFLPFCLPAIYLSGVIQHDDRASEYHLLSQGNKPL